MSTKISDKSGEALAAKDLFSKSLLRGQHILSVKQFGLLELEQLLAVAQAMRLATIKRQVPKHLDGMVLGEIFYEPSTRTSTSFDAAMKRVGGETVILNEAYSSTQKGESLEDTIRTVGQYTDAIVLRHPNENAVDAAAKVSPVPIINAGNGAREHPTQGLLDLLTIKEELGTIDGLTITFVGDLRYGRTVHSLYLDLPSELTAKIRDRGQLELVSTELSSEIVGQSDVIYCTRVQKERFADLELYERVKDSLTVDSQMMKHAKSRMILMHPLPRNKEVAAEVDADPRAAYFRQMKYGMFLRMALLSLVLSIPTDTSQ